MKEPIKVIIEVSGGVVQAVYAGSSADRLIDAVVVDHDNKSIGQDFLVDPLTGFDFLRDVHLQRRIFRKLARPLSTSKSGRPTATRLPNGRAKPAPFGGPAPRSARRT